MGTLTNFFTSMKKVLLWIDDFLRLALIVFAFVGCWFIAYWFMNQSPVVVVGESKADKTQVRRGETITFTRVMEKRRVCSGDVTRYLIGDCGMIPLYDGSNTMPGSFAGSMKVRIIIPEIANPGSCEYRTTVRYYCNPLDYVIPRIVDYPGILFEVVQ